MKKLFISQPMKGKTDEEILAVREQAIAEAKKLVGEDVEVIDSFFQDAPVGARPLWFLGKSIELLSTADVAYFAAGWLETRGCLIEHVCAKEYGIDCIENQTTPNPLFSCAEGDHYMIPHERKISDYMFPLGTASHEEESEE